MAKTLRGTVLSNYTYEEIRNMCFTEGDNFSLSFDCDWGVWRDKAVADFDISPQFFDLVPTLSGPQRYLQIASYVELSPLSGVRVYPDTGVIEGVYEAYRGYLEAKQRKDAQMMLWFYSRMKPIIQEELAILEDVDIEEEIETLALKWRKKPLGNLKRAGLGTDHLVRVIRTGNVAFLDAIIHNYFVLPQGFSIEKDIPKVPFWEFLAGNKAIYDLPLQNTNQGRVKAVIIAAVRKSLDTRIVDFFRSIFRDRNLSEMVDNYTSEREGKPEEAYGIALRFITPLYIGPIHEHMVEIILYLSTIEDMNRYYSSILSLKKGNVAFLQALLPFVNPDQIRQQEEFPDYSPLSTLLIQEYEDMERQPLVYQM